MSLEAEKGQQFRKPATKITKVDTSERTLFFAIYCKTEKYTTCGRVSFIEFHSIKLAVWYNSKPWSSSQSIAVLVSVYNGQLVRGVAMTYLKG